MNEYRVRPIAVRPILQKITTKLNRFTKAKKNIIISYSYTHFKNIFTHKIRQTDIGRLLSRVVLCVLYDIFHFRHSLIRSALIRERIPNTHTKHRTHNTDSNHLSTHEPAFNSHVYSFLSLFLVLRFHISNLIYPHFTKLSKTVFLSFVLSGYVMCLYMI